MADADEPDESGGDLFDRWLSHRQESSDASPRPRTYGVPRTGLVGEESQADDDADAPGDARETTGSTAGAPPAERSEQVLDPEPDALLDSVPDPAPEPERSDERLSAPGALTAGLPIDDPLRAEQTGADDGTADPARAWSDPDTVHPNPVDPGATGSDTVDPGATGPHAADPGAGGSEAEDPEQAVREAVLRAAGAPVADPPADERFRSRDEPAEAPPAAEPVREPVGLDEFEPVVLASVRRSAEAPIEKRSRLARFRRPGAGGPDEPLGADDTSDDAEQQTDAQTGGDTEEQTAVATSASASVSDEDTAEEQTVGAADDAPEPTTAPPASTDDQPTPPAPPAPAAPPPDAPAARDAAAEVFAAFNPGAPATPTPDQPSDQPSSDDGPATSEAPTSATPTAAPAPPTSTTGTTASYRPPPSAAPAPRHAAEPPARRRPRLPSVASYVEAARTTLDRSVRGTPDERAATTEPPPGQPTEAPAAGQPRTTTEPERDPALERSAYDELRDQREAAAPPPPDVLPPDIDFRPRTLARRVTSALLVVGLVATGLAAYRAYDSRVETDIGLAAILALATGIVWAVRAGSVPTRVGLHGGVLEVRTQAGRFVFEVTSPHTRLETVGTPGRRGWKLLVHRRGLAPFVVTTAMVDGRALTEALRYYRPDL